MKHYSWWTQTSTPVDRNDPESALLAEAMNLPDWFSPKARAAWDYLEDTVFLYRYKERYVVTDESLELTAYGDETSETPWGGPRWVVEDLGDLEQRLEQVCDSLVEDGELVADNGSWRPADPT